MGFAVTNLWMETDSLNTANFACGETWQGKMGRGRHTVLQGGLFFHYWSFHWRTHTVHRRLSRVSLSTVWKPLALMQAIFSARWSNTQLCSVLKTACLAMSHCRMRAFWETFHQNLYKTILCSVSVLTFVIERWLPGDIVVDCGHFYQRSICCVRIMNSAERSEKQMSFIAH